MRAVADRFAVIFLVAACASSRSVYVIGKDFLALAWQGLSYNRTKWASPLQLSRPLDLERRVPLCAPSQHRLAVYYLIVACASIAERLCNRKGLSRISVTRSFLLHKKNLAQRDKPFPMIAPRISSGFNPAAYHLCTAAYFCSQL